jgi:hypothetical protein
VSLAVSLFSINAGFWVLIRKSEVGMPIQISQTSAFAWVIARLQNVVSFSEAAIYDSTQNHHSRLQLDPPQLRSKGRVMENIDFGSMLQ